ncbi:MAG: chemotaxis protein CheW [Gallionellaceae bacterium]|jgi:purine-binding chemotaxis protein CheW
MNETTLDQVLTQYHEANQDIVNVDEATVKLVIFELGTEWFAINGERIREILAQAEVFFVPGSPASLEGVINVRGDIESVIRLHEMLHLPEQKIKPGSSILLGRGGNMSSGIRVDRVIDVIDLPESTIQPPPGTLPEHMHAKVLGVLRFKDKPVAVLDLDQIFSDYARGLG